MRPLAAAVGLLPLVCALRAANRDALSQETPGGPPGQSPVIGAQTQFRVRETKDVSDSRPATEKCKLERTWLGDLLRESEAAEPLSRAKWAQVPKIIWMYWGQGLDHAPDLVKNCVASWVMRNPTWKVVVLDDDTALELLPGWTKERWARLQPLAHRGDVVRVNVLRTDGGVWADAATFCTVPLDSWLPSAARHGFFAATGGGPQGIGVCPGCRCGSSEDEGPAEALRRAGRCHATPGESARSLHPSSQLIAAVPHNYIMERWFERYALYMLKHLRAPGVADNYTQLRGQSNQASGPGGQELDYYFLHRCFEDLARSDKHFRRRWLRTPELVSMRPHSVCRGAYACPLTHILKVRIQTPCSPYFKLNWRASHLRIGTMKTVQAYLFNQTHRNLHNLLSHVLSPSTLVQAAEAASAAAAAAAVAPQA